MTDNPNDPHEEETPDEEDAPAERDPAPRRPIPRLDTFAALQRHLASIDFMATHAAQRAIVLTGGFQKIVDAQNAIAKSFARSLDFSHLAQTYKALAGAGATAQAMAAQRQWAESLAKSIDFSALNAALASSTALGASAAFAESLRRQTDFFAQIADAVTFKLPAIGIPGLLEALDRWIPINLRDVVGLDVVATIALDEGLPLSWVPRTEIVLLIIEADGPEERIEILTEQRGDILDDCENAIASIAHEWAVQCRSAIAAMRSDLDSPAQSHASNIIDSIVLGLHGGKGRERAKARAQEDFDALPLQLAAESLTLRPLFRAFTTWFPNQGDDPPDYFARHATSHAVGHPGIFRPTSALLAVMLATSLTVQYAPEDSSTDANDSGTSP